MPDYSGLSIGPYRIIEPLGQGGMATVYRAFDTRLECDVAVKFVCMEQLPPAEVEKTRKRFKREAKEIARLTHPNIVKVTDYGEYKGVPYLVAPCLPGGTLKKRAGSPVPYDQAARLLAPVARALEYAHGKNLVHGDVRPSNILLTEEGQPVVSDFGIAKIFGPQGESTLITANVALDTAGYMAPEQWLNQVSPQSDIYSLGVVFYELVTGRKPYPADTPAEIFQKQSAGPLPRPGGFVAGLPAQVEKVLDRALAKKPVERYASMREFAGDLESLAKTAKPVQADSGIVQPDPDLPGPPKSSWVWAGIGIIAVLVGSLALIGWSIGEFTSSLTATQTAQALAVLPSAAGPTLPPAPIQTEPPATTATPVPTLTPTLGIGSTQVSSGDGMLLVYVPPGEFLMGSDKARDKYASAEEIPQHTVYLDAYWIDQSEVTNAQYALCVAGGQCKSPMSSSFTHLLYYGDSQYARFPVINVNWSQAEAYCTWAGRRLPSEAEWEKAARGSSGNIYPWGDAEPDQGRLNYSGAVGDTTGVGSYPSGTSPYGALDMAGNVSEWVNDWYNNSYYQQSPMSNPAGPDVGMYRVLRGGSWKGAVKAVRSAIRSRNTPDFATNDVGFRCAAGISP